MYTVKECDGHLGKDTMHKVKGYDLILKILNEKDCLGVNITRDVSITRDGSRTLFIEKIKNNDLEN